MNRKLLAALLAVPFLSLMVPSGTSQTAKSDGLMYIGTLDNKILVIDEDKEEVVGEIPMAGVPRATALSADQKKLIVVNTKMSIEVVDLAARKVISTFSLADPKTRPDMLALAPIAFHRATSTGLCFRGWPWIRTGATSTRL